MVRSSEVHFGLWPWPLARLTPWSSSYRGMRGRDESRSPSHLGISASLRFATQIRPSLHRSSLKFQAFQDDDEITKQRYASLGDHGVYSLNLLILDLDIPSRHSIKVSNASLKHHQHDQPDTTRVRYHHRRACSCARFTGLCRCPYCHTDRRTSAYGPSSRSASAEPDA
jgi:hypothetical protein